MRTAIPLLLVAALFGCERAPTPGAPAPAAPAKHTVAAHAQPSSAEQTADMVEAPSQGKSQAPVSLKFDVPQRPMVGQPLTVQIALLPQVPAGPVQVQIKGSAGVDVAPEARDFELPTVDAQQVYRHPVAVTPTAEGIQLIYVTVSLRHDEITDTRAFAVPLMVGPGGGTASAPAPAAATAAGAPARAPGRDSPSGPG